MAFTRKPVENQKIHDYDAMGIRNLKAQKILLKLFEQIEEKKGIT